MSEPIVSSVERQPEARAAGISARPFPKSPPGFVVGAVTRLRRMLLRMADSLAPADVAMTERLYGVAVTHLVGAAARHRVTDVLHGGPLTAEEIAERTGTDPDAMHRTLRALALLGVFALDESGRFSNNRVSRTLSGANASRVRDLAEHMASTSASAAWADYDHSLRTGTSAFDHVHGMGVWDWFEQHPDEGETFAQAMMGITIPAAPTIAATYPFAEVRRVCDVGGGRGTLLSELLLRHPHLGGVLYESPAVLDSARPLLRQRGVEDRVELAPGNFFDSVPSDCDAYILKSVLHDWDDEHCARILGACRSAMRPGDKLLIVEVMMEKNEVAFPALLDVQMLIQCGGRERTRAEFERLLPASGFRMARVFDTPGQSIIEGIAS
jgi:hypothetical protein